MSWKGRHNKGTSLAGASPPRFSELCPQQTSRRSRFSPSRQELQPISADVFVRLPLLLFLLTGPMLAVGPNCVNQYLPVGPQTVSASWEAGACIQPLTWPTSLFCRQEMPVWARTEHDHDGCVSVTPLPRKARDALESRFRTVGRVSRGDEQWVYSAAGKLFSFNFSGLLTDAIV